MEFLLFLSGPILGCTYESSSDWREYVNSKMPSYIKTISPMRGKEFLSKGQETIVNETLSVSESPLITSKGITCRDRFDIKRSDAVLINLIGAGKVTIGSMIELGWADAYRKPVILAIDPENIHHHPIVNNIASFILPTLDEAIQTAIAVLSPTYSLLVDTLRPCDFDS